MKIILYHCVCPAYTYRMLFASNFRKQNRIMEVYYNQGKTETRRCHKRHCRYLERAGLPNGQVGQRFPVEEDVAAHQTLSEHGQRGAVLLTARRQPLLPQLPHSGPAAVSAGAQRAARVTPGSTESGPSTQCALRRHRSAKTQRNLRAMLLVVDISHAIRCMEMRVISSRERNGIIDSKCS